MTIPSSGDKPDRSKSHVLQGLKLAVATAVLSILAFALIWRTRNEPTPDVPEVTPPVHFARVLPRPQIAGLPQPRTIMDDGVLVYSIRTFDEGDEMLVDVKTGKLLTVRDNKGLVIWEVPGKGSPMNTSETTKGS